MVYRVTSSFFYKKLMEKCAVIKYRDFIDDWINDAQLWTGSDIIPGNMYLLDSETLKGNYYCFKKCVLLCAGNYTPALYPLAKTCDLIVCPNLSLSQLTNYTFSILNQFRNWRNQMYDLILTNGTFEAMFNASFELSRMTFLLFDHEFSCLGISDYFFNRKSDLLPCFIQEIQEDENGCFKSHFYSNEIYYFDSSTLEEQLLFCNICSNSVHQATLCVRLPEQTYRNADMQFIQYMISILNEYYCKFINETSFYQKKQEIVSLFVKIMNGLLIDMNTAADSLLSIGWMTYHNYQVLKLERIKHDDISFSTTYFCSLLEKEFSPCVAFFHEEDFFCVLNISLRNASYSEHLPLFLRENLCKAGVSNICSGLVHVYQAFAQAKTALILGNKSDNTLWYYLFENYAFDYLNIQCTKEYSAEQVIHSALNTLKNHDKKKGTDYYNTLRVYLENNMNASQTAKKLFIHRSTLLQRLSVILKLTKIDLSDYKERTYLQLSYVLLDQK